MKKIKLAIIHTICALQRFLLSVILNEVGIIQYK
jgi:hypothetical protein